MADKSYFASTGLWAEHARLVGTCRRFDFGVDFGKARSKAGLPDNDRTLAGISDNHAMSANARVQMSGYLEEACGSLPNLMGTRAALSVSGLYAWVGGLMTSVQLGQQLDTRRGPEPLFGMTRNDETTSLSVKLYRDFRIGVSPRR